MSTLRKATPADADAIAEVHMASIRTIGAGLYSAEIIAAWGAPRDGSRYLHAMESGEIFLVVPGEADKLAGFSSYRYEEGKHRTAIYVRGGMDRRGIGTALYLAAEEIARQQGATEIHVTASLVAVDFYLANGFEKLSVGEHLLNQRIPMACVFMRKRL